MKHRLNTDQAELGTNTGRPGRTAVRFRQGTRARVGYHLIATGSYRIGSVFCRIRVRFHRIATGYYRIIFGFYRLLPHITASYRINFFWRPSGAGFRSQESEGGGPLLRSEAMEYSVGLCGKNFGFLRIFPRFSTILRTEQGRNYAILRIFTGGTDFTTRMGFPSPPRDGCPNRVVRSRETWCTNEHEFVKE